MAEPLLSLTTSGSMKHVVPWKTRSDFLDVYRDLYSDNLKSKQSAVGRIAAWKSRAGNKLSVAIESSGALMQVKLQHIEAQQDGKLQLLDNQLRYTYSLALIRFVNHITEKAQTKAVAQPVHLVAREFGIPEWIVRLRHEATHGSLPCLDALANGASWALEYLRQNFWEHQRSEAEQTDAGSTPETAALEAADVAALLRDLRDTRQQFIDKDKDQAGDSDENKDKLAINPMLQKLQRMLTQNRMMVIKTLLEDGFLIATDEQLQMWGIDSNDVVNDFPPTIPHCLAFLWRPVLRCVNKDPGALALLLHSAVFSVTSEHGLRNYLLVAWLRLILANTSSSLSRSQCRKRQVRWKECYLTAAHPLPTSVLLAACMQNMNKLTVHLLRYLVSKESLGTDSYTKVTQLLQLAEGEGDTSLSGHLSSPRADSDSSSGSDSDSESVYTLKDVQLARGEGEGQISSSTVEDIEQNIDNGAVIQWNIVTDVVDWSTVPLGMLPEDVERAAITSKGNDNSNRLSSDCPGMESHSSNRKRGRRHKRRDGRNDDEEDEDEEEESDEKDEESSDGPSRSKLIVTDDVLI